MGSSGMGVGGGNGGGGFSIGEVKPENTTIVNSVSDLPVPTDLGDGLGLLYRIDNRWNIGKSLTLDYGFGPTTNGSIFILDLQYNTITLTQGTLFSSNAINYWDNVFVIDGQYIGNLNTQVFDFNGVFAYQNLFTSERNKFFNFGKLGALKKQTIAEFRSNSFINFGEGLTLENNLNNIMHYVLTTTSTPINDSHINVIGSITPQPSSTSFSQIKCIPLPNDSAFFFAPDLNGFVNIDVGHIILDYGGVAFKTGSLNETEKNVLVTGVRRISNSEILGSFSWNNNTTETPLLYDAGDYNIILFSDAGGGEVELSTSVTHDIVNGQPVWIVGSSYEGQYVATNVGSTTFNIIAVFNPTALNQGGVTVGWEKVLGTTTSKENERITHVADNELIFDNIEKARKRITLTSTTLRGTSGSGTPTFDITLAKNSVPIHNVNNEFFISSVDVSDTTPRNANIAIIERLEKEDSLSVYVRIQAGIGSGNFLLLNGTLIID